MLSILAGGGVALQACSEPRFEFRGYSDLSSCTEIIDAELASGGTFQGGFESEDIENPGYVTELSGTLFSESVRIDIQCNPRGFISSIHYISAASDPMDTGAVWALFSSELETLFGEPTEILTEEGRSRRYICHNPSPALLDEWRLEGEEEDEVPLHEIYLAIDPRAAQCQEEATE